MLLGQPLPAGTPIADADLSPRLRDVIESHQPIQGMLTVAGERVLVVTSQPVERDGRDLGVVVTMRDRTQLDEMVRELDTVRALSDGLRLPKPTNTPTGCTPSPDSCTSATSTKPANTSVNCPPTLQPPATSPPRWWPTHTFAASSPPKALRPPSEESTCSSPPTASCELLALPPSTSSPSSATCSTTPSPPPVAGCADRPGSSCHSPPTVTTSSSP